MHKESLTVKYFCGFTFLSNSSVVPFCYCLQFYLLLLIVNYMVIPFSFYSCELKLFLILPDVIMITFSDYKGKIGFTGQLLIEPKPKEPTKHQYDYGKHGTI